MVNTKQIYLSVLENGLSLVAVNLPSLWRLFAEIEPENVIRSVRSMLSLRSSQSATAVDKPDSRSATLDPTKKHSASNSSQSHLVHLENESSDTYAMHDIEGAYLEVPLPQGKSQVTDRITQSAMHV